METFWKRHGSLIIQTIVLVVTLVAMAVRFDERLTAVEVKVEENNHLMWEHIHTTTGIPHANNPSQ